MREVLRFFLNLCILIIIYSVVGALTSKSKNGKYVMAVMFALTVVVIAGFISNINFKTNNFLDMESYEIDYSDVWQNTLTHMEEKLEEQMMSLVEENGLKISSIDVKLKTDYKKFEIESVEINGLDKVSAKNLIAGYFKIGIAYINTNGV